MGVGPNEGSIEDSVVGIVDEGVVGTVDGTSVGTREGSCEVIVVGISEGGGNEVGGDVARKDGMNDSSWLGLCDGGLEE